MKNKKGLHIFIIAILLLNLLQCKNEEPNIYKLESFSSSKNIDGTLYLNEVYVVANHPTNDKELIELIKKFNDTTLKDDIAKKIKLSHKRTFYKETQYLNKDLKEKLPIESGYFEKTDLSAYYKDKLVVSSWTISKKITGYYTSFLTEKTGITEHFSENFNH